MRSGPGFRPLASLDCFAVPNGIITDFKRKYGKKIPQEFYSCKRVLRKTRRNFLMENGII
jgi:hypothetical protein